MSRRRSHLCGALPAVVVFTAACGLPSSGPRRNASGSESGSAPSDSPSSPSEEGSAEALEVTAAAATGTDNADGAGGVAIQENGEKHLKAPTLSSWKAEFRAGGAEEAEDGYTHRATATEFEVPLYGSPGDKWPIGMARIGGELPAKPASGSGCRGGTWYQVSGGAHACTNDGLHVRPASSRTGAKLSEADLARQPNADRPGQFQYAKVRENGLPRLERLPSEDEIDDLAKAVEEGRGMSSVVRQWLHGTYLLALTRKVTVGGRDFYETIHGNFVREEDLLDKPTPEMRGEKLGERYSLPLAFAHEKSTLYCKKGGALSQCGEVEKHARFNVKDEAEHDGEKYLLGEDGIAVKRSKVRLLEKIARPDGVDAEDKWLHINLSQQSLVAYEGDEPVYATLISSGLPTHATPAGLYQVQRKYLSKTMRGKDDDGPYEVQEVPWTMYYDGNYAVHGAYWHNRFGKTKSHGCTNVPPADARWLYYWTELELPEGWHAMFHKRGTHFYFTGKTPPEMPE